MGAAGAGAGVGAGLGLISAQGQAGLTSYNNQIANANASMLEQQADRQYKIGVDQMQAYGRKVNQTVGAQRAAMAAGGVDVNTGSALDVQTETKEIGAEDIRRIQTNAYLEALGMRSQANNMRSQASYNTMAANNTGTASILTGGISGFTQAGGYSLFSKNGKT